MEFRILGPLEACDSSGAEIRLPTGRERALLAALLLRRGEVVSTDSLVDALWGKRPPSTAAKAVQGYVSHLRRALGDGVLITQSPGYVLRVDVGSIDAERFEQLAAEGRRALEDADPGGALASLDAALALWRGPALSDFTFNDFAQSEIQRLTERRLETQENRIEALLELGRHGGLVAELEALVATHPGRERLCAQLMLALYRAGRQAEALDVFRDGRRRAAELGLEPGPDLVRLERAILNHDPSLGVERPSGSRRDRASSRTEAPVPPDSVAVIDPERSQVVGHVRVGRRPVALAIGHGSVWVANSDDGTVSRIDPDRHEVVRTIGIGAPVVDLAVASDAIWVANGSDGTVTRIDPGADAVVETIDLRGSSELVWNPTYAADADDDSVWIAAGPRHVLRIDPTTNEPSAIIDVGHVPVGVALGDEALWVVTTAERALRIEPHTNTATAEVPIGYPVALTAGKQAVWVSDRRGQVWRINPDTGTVTQTTPVGGGLVGMCATDGVVFAANNTDGTVVQIDPQDGRVEGLIAVGHAPTDVAFLDGTVWVSIQSESAM
jgi:DNA-binding SARP family transcriptional activator/outer membrane protein assembly factor BamB